MRLAEYAVRTAATGLEPGARELLDNTQAAVASAAEQARVAARELRALATRGVQELSRNIDATVETTLRPLDLGTERALGEIIARLEALPQSAFEDVTRLQAQIMADASRIAGLASDDISEMHGRAIEDTSRTMAECYSMVLMIQERAEALHPRTVLAAGYAILRDRVGSPLTSLNAVRTAGLITADMRDGTVQLRNDEFPNSTGEKK